LKQDWTAIWTETRVGLPSDFGANLWKIFEKTLSEGKRNLRWLGD
jgi:hypothetical protein